MQWELSQSLLVVAATGCLSLVGSAMIFAHAEIRRKRSSGSRSRLLGAACTGGSGLVAGIAAACCLVELPFFVSRPYLSVGISIILAMTWDMSLRSGWIMMLRVVAGIATSGLRALQESQDAKTAKTNETDEKTES